MGIWTTKEIYVHHNNTIPDLHHFGSSALPLNSKEYEEVLKKHREKKWVSLEDHKRILNRLKTIIQMRELATGKDKFHSKLIEFIEKQLVEVGE